MNYRITNVKVSVKSPSICLDSALKTLTTDKVFYKKFSNYLVIQNVYTYVIFKPKFEKGTSHINITKIPNMGEIENAKLHLGNLLKKEISFAHVIDNITVSTKLDKNCNPKEVIHLFQKHCKITFNQETFPGVFLKFPYGTAIIFHTGRCILIGCKNIENIENILDKILNILK
jgi:hypothetical protein